MGTPPTTSSRPSPASVTRSPTTTCPSRPTPSLPRTRSLTTVARRRAPSPPLATSSPPLVLSTASGSVPPLASASVVTCPPLSSLARRSSSPSLSPRSTVLNEFTRSVGQVRMRWPLGLGKYLMDKLEEAMMSRGVLEVDKISGKRGNFVYINGRSVGLSNKLNDFSKLAAPMGVYEGTLAKLTAQITKSAKGKKPAGKIVVKPPEWQGK